VSTGNSKAAVILAGCAVLGPATAVFRFMKPDTTSEDYGALAT
jgi:hypothetical protein